MLRVAQAARRRQASACAPRSRRSVAFLNDMLQRTRGHGA